MRALLDTHGSPARVADTDGRHLAGDSAAAGSAHPLEVGGEVVGSLVADDPALATALVAILAVEAEKRALADETLGRYKELTLLYDMSEQFARLLDLDSVGRHAVEQCRRHLRAEAADLFVLNAARDALEPLAQVGTEESTGLDLDASNEVCARVFYSGHAEITSDGDAPVLCAPLRHGESVLGVLRITHRRGAEWSAGDLKLVTALAANVASALHKARLHTEQVHAMALRHQVQRHTSPDLLEAVFDGDTAPSGAEIAVLFSDLRASAGNGDSPEAVLQRVDQAVAQALAILVEHGAVVDLPLGEMLVAVFWDPEGFGQAAQRAIAAATTLEGGAGLGAGIGIAGGALDDDPAERLDGTINAAARLHESADGRVVVDARIRQAADGWRFEPCVNGPLPEGCFEVRG
ncbi:MAG: GAF domain-containing protein [Alphaproteobacteria bacterium]|nr:GAF domain-containing protein [Alphaproteobacteria bacterium]